MHGLGRRWGYGLQVHYYFVYLNEKYISSRVSFVLLGFGVSLDELLSPTKVKAAFDLTLFVDMSFEVPNRVINDYDKKISHKKGFQERI